MTPRTTRNLAVRLNVGLILTLLAASAPSQAQTFGVGVAGSLLNDTGTAANLRGFDFAAGHAYLQMVLEPGVMLEARASVFTLPGGIPNSPTVPTEAFTLSVAYLFREEWCRAGFIGGVGGYRLAPRKPRPDQEFYDDRETAVGFHGGILGVFPLGGRWDLRLEGTIHTIRTDVQHTPIFITSGLTYRF